MKLSISCKSKIAAQLRRIDVDPTLFGCHDVQGTTAVTVAVDSTFDVMALEQRRINVDSDVTL